MKTLSKPVRTIRKETTATQQTIDLGGEWTLRQAGKKETVKAIVPGAVHTDLLTAGKIPDPYYRDNEDRLQWIGETDWIYQREFDIQQEFLKHEQIILRCAGLDTLATIKINSRELSRTNNMFRTWEFDVKHLLKEGRNIIVIRFDSTIPYIKIRDAEHHIPLREPPHGVNGANWVRKEQCNYGWDWGPCLLTCGIWRPIKLIACNATRLGDVDIRQKHAKDGSVTLDITSGLTNASKTTSTVSIIVAREDKTIIAGTTAFKNGKAHIARTITNPELWWPNDMGNQPLYTVTVNLIGQDGSILDTAVKRIGLRIRSLIDTYR
jgi:beta-mannosidase